MLIDLSSFSLAALFAATLIVFSALYCRQYLSIVILGLIARVLLIYIHEETNLFGDLDIEDYLQYLTNFRDTWDTNLTDFLRPHAWFSTLLYSGWIFNLLEEQGLWVIRLANAAMGVAVIVPLNWIHEFIFGKRLNQFQACLIIFWPTWMRHNVDIGRTAPSVLAVLFALAGLFSIISSRTMRWKLEFQITTLLSIILSCLLRVHYIAYFIPILCFSLLTQIRRPKMHPSLRWLMFAIASILGVAIFAGLLFVYQQLSQGNFSANVLTSEEGALDYAKLRDEGGSAYLQGIFPNTSIDWLWFIPLQGFYFIFSPMPWDIRSAFMAGSCIQAWLIFYWCILLLFYARNIIQRNTLVKILLLTILFTSLAFGTFTKNAGGAERWRLPSTLLLIPTSTTLIELAKRRRKAIRMESSYSAMS
jgi:hypothetical protein